MAYQPIENYGIIGDMHTVALIGMNGSIDWFCFPHFDSPSVFAAILDDQKGGRFVIAPRCNGVSHKQFYWPDTNILVTRFLSPDGVGEMTDYMPVGEAARASGHRQLIRRVSVIRGTMQFEMECHPAFNYARDDHSVEVTADGVSFHSKDLSLGLATNIPIKQDGHAARASFTLNEGDTVAFVLREVARGEGCGATLEVNRAEELFRQTVTYWRTWLSKCTYTGRWREMVHRSALALKLLTFEPTGAIVAAPTCALPETLGGERNWDYRYTWIRDAAFTIYGLLRIGFTEEAAKFMQWLEARSHELNDDGSLQIMYGIDGRHTLTEETLDHLEGYRGSRPIRIGNGAYNQLQLDIYGELMDSVYLYNKYGAPISYDLWRELRRLINWLCDNWHREDEGIWEVRGGQQHFVYSKLMCWVAFDRAIRLADKRSFPSDRDRWRKIRDQIYEEIMDKGWSEERQAFVQSYGSQALDASNLMMPLVFFLSPNDPRMLKTLDATSRSLSQGGLMASGLVYRYDVNQT
ncbi:MAG: glycoside hydrolase family 15 protein, partial [Chloroflexota bacterium]